MTEMKYSPFFDVLHDERMPVGYLGRGTHYSVLRAPVWQDENLKPMKQARLLDFCVIWDEDHDVRVIEVIEALYFKGLLSPVRFIGERKGSLSVLMSQETWLAWDPARWRDYCTRVGEVSRGYEDPWETVGDRVEGVHHSIIHAPAPHVRTYLANIQMLWQLGMKSTEQHVNVNALQDAEQLRALSAAPEALNARDLGEEIPF